ncbi:hypothetical protein TNCV_906611 [Trichonephila clavipes]|nr:hypothetical protein TNCV_906611 [Trichonephila clavipes]
MTNTSRDSAGICNGICNGIVHTSVSDSSFSTHCIEYVHDLAVAYSCLSIQLDNFVLLIHLRYWMDRNTWKKLEVVRIQEKSAQPWSIERRPGLWKGDRSGCLSDLEEWRADQCFANQSQSDSKELF